MPRHPLHDLYMGNAALAPHSTPLLLPFPLLSCREITSATSLQRVRCITFGGFLHGPLGSMRRSSPVTPAVDTVLAPKMHVGVSKPKLGDILSILTLSLVSKVWSHGITQVSIEEGSTKLWSRSDLQNLRFQSTTLKSPRLKSSSKIFKWKRLVSRDNLYYEEALINSLKNIAWWAFEFSIGFSCSRDLCSPQWFMNYLHNE